MSFVGAFRMFATNSPPAPFDMIRKMLNTNFDSLPIFEGVPPAKMRLIKPLLKPCTFEPDESIFQQGDLAKFFYILLQGEVLVHYKPYDGPPLEIAHLQDSGVFGWSAALRRKFYTSGALALVKCEVVRLSGDRLRSLCETHPAAGAVLLECLSGLIAERLQHSRVQMLNVLCDGMELSESSIRRYLIHD